MVGSLTENHLQHFCIGGKKQQIELHSKNQVVVHSGLQPIIIFATHLFCLDRKQYFRANYSTMIQKKLL